MLLACESGGAPLSLSLSSPLPSRARLDLPVDTLALVHLDRSLNEVGVVLWEAIQRQLHAVVTAMLWKVGSCQSCDVDKCFLCRLPCRKAVCTMWLSTTSLPPLIISPPSPSPTRTLLWLPPTPLPLTVSQTVLTVPAVEAGLCPPRPRPVQSATSLARGTMPAPGQATAEDHQCPLLQATPPR